MATPREVQALVRGLHDQQIVNLDASLSSLMETPGLNIVDPGVEVGWYALGGDHFVLVCGGVGGELEAVINVANSLRGDIAATKSAFGNRG